MHGSTSCVLLRVCMVPLTSTTCLAWLCCHVSSLELVWEMRVNTKKGKSIAQPCISCLMAPNCSQSGREDDWAKSVSRRSSKILQITVPLHTSGSRRQNLTCVVTPASAGALCPRVKTSMETWDWSGHSNSIVKFTNHTAADDNHQWTVHLCDGVYSVRTPRKTSRLPAFHRLA